MRFWVSALLFLGAGFPPFLLAGTLPGSLPTAGLMQAPFDIKTPVAHQISMSFDPVPARDFLSVLSGSQEAPQALRRLRGSMALSLALETEKVSADQFFGRLAAAAAGSPEPAFQSVASRRALYSEWIDALEREAVLLARGTGLRIASLLPAHTRITSQLRVVPVFGLARFGEVETLSDDDDLYFIVDLERLVRENQDPAKAREALLRVLRTSAASAWRTLFEKHHGKDPAWSGMDPLSFDAYLSRTVLDGTSSIFLFPDEFFPLASLLEEPVNRSFERWNLTAEVLLDPKKTEKEKQGAFERIRSDDLWGRFTGVVGAQMCDALLRKVGRAAYLDALEKGPRAVAMLYLSAFKGSKMPAFSKTVRKELEKTPLDLKPS